MAVPTTVHLDEELLARLEQARSRTGLSMDSLVARALEASLPHPERVSNRIRIQPVDMGQYPHLNYDSISELLAHEDDPAS